MDDLKTKQQEVRLLKTQRNFDKTHERRGGLLALTEMMGRYATLREMGDHFDLSYQRMAQITEVLLGMPYSQYLAKHNKARAGRTALKENNA